MASAAAAVSEVPRGYAYTLARSKSFLLYLKTLLLLLLLNPFQGKQLQYTPLKVATWSKDTVKGVFTFHFLVLANEAHCTTFASAFLFDYQLL